MYKTLGLLNSTESVKYRINRLFYKKLPPKKRGKTPFFI